MINFEFSQRHTEIIDSLGQNGAAISRLGILAEKLNDSRSISVDSIIIEGWASPEGTVAQNRLLSLKRRAALRQLLLDNKVSADSTIVEGRSGIAWKELEQWLRDDNPAYAADILAIIADEPHPGKYDTRKKRIMDHDCGRSWKRMLEEYFPRLRHATALIYMTEKVGTESPDSIAAAPTEIGSIEEVKDIVTTVVANGPEKEDAESVPVEKNFYMSISTNMLYDIAALPNIAAEFYLGKQFSVTGGWMYGWWNSRTKNRFWRAYGGQIGGRYWFGKLSEKKPLTGHHIGIYAQAHIYDFEWGGKGYLGGTPKHNIFDHPTIGAGVEYGFALPVSRYLNIDFNIGIGYLGGRYYEYEPKDNHYVWLRTKQLRWFGPTKVEVSLVWLLGHDNFNRREEKK